MILKIMMEYHLNPNKFILNNVVVPQEVLDGFANLRDISDDEN
jgi:hypothetical protein